MNFLRLLSERCGRPERSGRFFAGVALPNQRAEMRRSPLRRPAIVVALCFLVSCGLSRVSLAQPGQGGPPSILATPVKQFNGSTLKTPGNLPMSRRTGMTVSVDPRWSNNYGYWPVEVTVVSATPLKNTRTITIQLRSGWNRNVSVEQEFEFPAGSSTVTTTVSLPVYQPSVSSYVWWDIWVDGKHDEDLSIDLSEAAMRAGGAAANAGSGVMFLTTGAPANQRGLVSTNANELQVLSLELQTFPTKWIDYTAVDVVALTLDDARKLKASRPAAFEAIQRWTHVGGQLWIYEAGQEWENLADASALFKVAPALLTLDELGAPQDPGESPAETNEKSGPTESEKKEAADTAKPKDATRAPSPEGWRPLRFRRFRPDGQVMTFVDTRTGDRQTVRDPEVIARMETDPNLVATEQRVEPEPSDRPRRFTADSSEWFVEQPLGLGVVRAFRGKNDVASFPLLPPPTNQNAVANSDAPDELPRSLSIGLRRTRQWNMRHGMTPDSPNTEFAKLLVPGVGLAPVTEFRVLITLFVLVIGPLNYYLLKRAKRLHLMVLTVPAAAIVATVALFAYAVVADGFDTRYRARSYAEIDQRSGEAVCWSWLSYYSGLAPGNGLTVPADAAIYPILPSWAGDGSLAENHELVWKGDEAQLKQGWLNSRTPTQYLTVRARKSPIWLEVLDSGEKVRVQNHLGQNISSLVVITASGKMYWGENVAADGSLFLAPIERDDAIRRLSKLVTENAPLAPDALAVNDREWDAMRARSRYGYFGRFGQQFLSGKLTENLANTAIMNLAGLGGAPALDLPAKSYVAITERGAEVAAGIEGATEEGGFHVIEGRW